MRQSFPLYTQLDLMDCGPSCLRMIAAYYGREHSLQFLRERCFITRLGVSILGISDAAEFIGFRTMYVRATLEQLVKESPFPCILHWNQNHFVVCYKVRKRGALPSRRKKARYVFYIADPAGEKYTMTEEEFARCWISSSQNGEPVGTALLLTPTPKLYEQPEHEEEPGAYGLSYFFKYLRPYKWQMVQIGVGLLLGLILSLLAPFLTQSLVDHGIGASDLDFIYMVLIAQVGITTISMLVGFLQSWLALYLSTQVSISLISGFLAKLMKLPMRFFDSKNVGDIMQRIGDHGRIEDFLLGSSFSIVLAVLNFAIFSVVMVIYSWQIFLIFCVGNLLYFSWVLLFMRYRRQLDYRRFAQAAAEQSSLLGLITSMPDIKLSNCGTQQKWKWERIQIKLFRISIDGVRLGQIQSVGAFFISQTSSVIISTLCARLVVTGEITLGMMMSISYIIGQLSAPIAQFVGFAHSLQDAKISLERLGEVHHRQDEDQDLVHKMNELPLVKSLELRGVTFSYSGSERDKVLHDVSLHIPEGQVTAIVGESGCGKTTIAKLLLGYYTPQQGGVYVGGSPLDSVNPYVWRSHVGAVLQESGLFSDTIAYNIAPSETEPDLARLHQAARKACIHEFIESLPLNYNTKIGMEGTGLSQGQKQRLLIARALYKDPCYVILDEATNALDAINEASIIDNLYNSFKDKTVLIIAHRLSTIKRADNIVVMGHGEVLEQGSHSDLLAKQGYYYQLLHHQLEYQSL